jgi:thiamine biosynthesis lipoprotein
VTADRYLRSAVSMGTVVTIEVVDADPAASGDRRATAVDQAFAWFDRLEATCSRFLETSELRQLEHAVGTPVVVSQTLYSAIEFALAVALETDGAFDPTVGRVLVGLGFADEHRRGHRVAAESEHPGPVSYRDVTLDPATRTVTVRQPLTLDLGAVAKGLAVDLAASELRAASLTNFAIDAGGDLYLAGQNAVGEPWTVGVRHPRRPEELLGTLRLSNLAVCTSGDYARRTPAGHHLVNPRTGASVPTVASVTVVAPTAMLADAVSTALFVLGPTDGLALCDRLGLDGLIVTPTGEQYQTDGFIRQYDFRSPPASDLP